MILHRSSASLLPCHVILAVRNSIRFGWAFSKKLRMMPGGSSDKKVPMSKNSQMLFSQRVS